MVQDDFSLFEHEDEHEYEYEDEKNQIRSYAFALPLFLFSAFPIFSRGIVPPYRTTTGPTSEFLTPDT